MVTIEKPVKGQIRHFATHGVGTEEEPLLPIHDVYIQDQTTPIIMLPMAQQLGLTHLANDAVFDEYTVVVDSASGIAIGQHFRIINAAADRYYFGTILDISGVNITLDTSVDFEYVAGSEVTFSNINMAVDGSVTPVHFHLRTGTPSIPSSVDIVKMTMVCETATPVDLSKFGDLAALTKGLVFRELNGAYHNIFNVKTNKDFVNISTEFTPFLSTNPAQGVDGFSWQSTFGGQDEVGVVIRVSQYGQLGLIVQDDLRDLTSLVCFLKGHVVD